MTLKTSLMTLAVAAALATGALIPDSVRAATPPRTIRHAPRPMTEADVRALLTVHGYNKIDHVLFAGKVWTANGTTVVGNTFNLRVDPLTKSITVDYDGDHNNAKVPANGLSKEAITARLQAVGYTQIENVQMDNGVWTAQAWDATNTAIQLQLDPIDGHIISKR